MKTIILNVSDALSEKDAIAAIAAAGLEVEQRLPIAYLMEEDGPEPVYSVREWMTKRGYSFGEDLYIIAEASQQGGCTIIDEIWLKANDGELMREELRGMLDDWSDERITVAGFAGKNALRPLMVVDGVSVQCDLGPLSRARYANQVTIGSAVDAAGNRTVTVIVDIKNRRVDARMSALDL